MKEKDKGFHQTTEEELNNLPPMGKTQKTVLVVAAIIVIVGIGYCVLSIM